MATGTGRAHAHNVAGSSLGYRVARAIKLLDLYGDQVFAAAATDLIGRGLSDVGALAVACEKHRKDPGRLVPSPSCCPTISTTPTSFHTTWSLR